MNWLKLQTETQLEEIKVLSQSQPVLIFKHSTRCPVSSTALSRLERAWKGEETGSLRPYFLDLIAYRNLSNQVATDFEISHESPQVLLIRNGQCVYDASHLGISYREITEQARQTEVQS